MAQRPTSGSISTAASGLASWCRKTLFGSKEHEEEAEPLKGVTLVETEGDVGTVEECPICTTISKNKLCAAVPCKHEACERCWHTWQKQSGHKTCMICAQPIKSVAYTASARLSKNKGSHFAKAADEALEDALRSMLRVKNELLEIVEKSTFLITSFDHF